MLKFPFISFALSLSAVGFTTELDSRKISRLERQIEALTDGLAPGLAVGMVKDGQVIYEKYAGYANLEHEVKVSAKTRFNIASNAKQFTALCILELANDERLDLDADLRDYLPEMFGDVDDDLPLFSLLNHSSGIRDVYGLWSLQGHTWWKRFLDNGDALALLEKQRHLNSEPGSDFGYSNSNYLLLAEIVKRVTDQPFTQCANAMFERLGMNETCFLAQAKAVIPNRASPYGNWNGWKKYPTITSLHGDGGLFSTLSDQLTWERIIQTRRSVDIDEALIETSQGVVSGCDIEEYGYGVCFGEFKGLTYAYHEGNTGAYNATFVRFPGEALSVVAMSNSGSVSTYRLARDLAEAALPSGKLESILYPSAPKVIGRRPSQSKMVGTYEMEDGTILRIAIRNGQLISETYSASPGLLTHEKGNVFVRKDQAEARYAFESTSQGRSLTIFQSFSPPRQGTLRGFEPIEADEAASICGRFFNEETETEIVISHRSGNEYGITKNGRERTGTLVVRDRLRERSYIIRVVRDSSGQVTGLLVDRDRIKNVEFVKR